MITDFLVFYFPGSGGFPDAATDISQMNKELMTANLINRDAGFFKSQKYNWKEMAIVSSETCHFKTFISIHFKFFYLSFCI